MSYEYLRKQKEKEKRDKERWAPKGFAKIVSLIGGAIGFLLYVAYEYAAYSCGDYAVYDREGGSACGPFRVLYDFFTRLNS